MYPFQHYGTHEIIMLAKAQIITHKEARHLFDQVSQGALSQAVEKIRAQDLAQQPQTPEKKPQAAGMLVIQLPPEPHQA